MLFPARPPLYRSIFGSWAVLRLREARMLEHIDGHHRQLMLPDTQWIDENSEELDGGTKRCSLASSFERLPVEIHREVFSHLSDYSDVYALSLLNLRLWRIGREYLKMNIAAHFLCLMNKSLMCCGIFDHGYPEGLFTDAQEAELLAEHLSLAAHRVPAHKTGINLLDIIFETQHNRFFDFPEFFPTPPKSQLYYQARDKAHPFPEIEERQAAALAWPKEESFFPPHLEWVLRNLTREYVTEAAIQPLVVSNGEARELGFFNVVLWRIFWHSDPDLIIHTITQLRRGAWAGHRFDIVPARLFERERALQPEEGWMDVSKELRAGIEEFWLRYLVVGVED